MADGQHAGASNYARSAGRKKEDGLARSALEPLEALEKHEEEKSLKASHGAPRQPTKLESCDVYQKARTGGQQGVR